MAYSDVSMMQLAVELQQAKDRQIENYLDEQGQRVNAINVRSLFVAGLVQKLLIERNKDDDQINLTHLEEEIREFREVHHPNTGYIDPFYDVNLSNVDTHQVDRIIADLQEIMRRDANEIQRVGRDNEFAVHQHSILTEMLAKQKNDEKKTMIRNQRSHG